MHRGLIFVLRFAAALFGAMAGVFASMLAAVRLTGLRAAPESSGFAGAGFSGSSFSGFGLGGADLNGVAQNGMAHGVAGQGSLGLALVLAAAYGGFWLGWRIAGGRRPDLTVAVLSAALPALVAAIAVPFAAGHAGLAALALALSPAPLMWLWCQQEAPR